jgi:hypothetical protein
MDSTFGLIHIKIQTWFPLTIQIYLNGQYWLSHKLKAAGVGYTMLDNVFVWIEDHKRAQSFADRFVSLPWVKILDHYAKMVNPFMETMLAGYSYYWVTVQSELATDILFKNREALANLYPHLVKHSLTCFGAKEVMGFLGKKLHGKFEGEVVTDVLNLIHLRIPGYRVKHRVKENWLKMYDKGGLVLRIETVINNPEMFRIRREVKRKGESQMAWVEMRKGVANLFRYREVALVANKRYLDALAVVSDPGTHVKELERLTQPKESSSGRKVKALNPLSKEDLQIIKALMDGEHTVRGFTNQNIREILENTSHLARFGNDEKRKSAKVSRIFHRFLAYGLISKIRYSRLWRITKLGRRLMATAIQVRELNFPQLLALAA